MSSTIFMRTYRKDAQWLKYSLPSIQRFCSGYDALVVTCPINDRKIIESELMAHWHRNSTPLNFFSVENDEARGYMDQQATKLCADKFCSSENILFTDSDVLFTKPNTPESWLNKDEKIIHLVTPWKDVGQAICWKEPTEKALGWEAPFETMRRFPMTFPASVIRNCRSHIERFHCLPIRDYILKQDKFSEFNVLGNYALHNEPEAFHFLDTSKEPLPELLARQFWSWGGITPEVMAEIKQILSI